MFANTELSVYAANVRPGEAEARHRTTRGFIDKLSKTHSIIVVISIR